MTNSRKNILKDILITLGLTILPLQVLMAFQETAKIYYQSIVFIIVILLSFLAVKIIGKPENLTLNAKNMRILFTKGWYIILASFILAILNFMGIDFSIIPSTSQIIFFLY